MYIVACGWLTNFYWTVYRHHWQKTGQWKETMTAAAMS